LKLVEHDIITGTNESGTRTDEPRVEDDGLGRLAKQRGISENVLRAANIRTEPRGRKYAGWWSIPYPHRTGTWKYRYRNDDPEAKDRYRDDQGADFHLYNPLRLGPGEDEVWFAEGEFDTLCLIDQGLKAIGIGGVSNVKTKEELDKDSDPDDAKESKRWKKVWALLFQETVCITIFDNDDKGVGPGRMLARSLDGVAFDAWENGYGDVNDWHLADPEGLADAISRFRYGFYRSRGMEPQW
jgi:hypothetical protein